MSSPYKSAVIAMISLMFSTLITSCTPVAEEGSMGASGAANSLSSDCKDQKRRLDQMVAKGQANSDAYRKMLDGYWGKCA